ncbi:MAG: hypothetical protein JO041_07860 [Acidobacteria bacterium]|nr:hypothetical protein [Acidobacteriota bacterium]
MKPGSAACACPIRPAVVCHALIPAIYNEAVKKEVRIYRSFQEAEEAEAQSDMTMTPEERVKMVIDLRDRRHPDAAQQRLARVCRIVKLERS